VIRSLDGGAAFAVARSGGCIRPLSPEEAAAGSDCRVSRIYGVAGIIRLLAGSYVLIITSRKDAGSYQGSPVYHANSMKFLCCNEAIKDLTPQEVWKNYRLACNFTHIVWSNKHWLYFLLGHCSTWSLHLNSLYYLPAEKG